MEAIQRSKRQVGEGIVEVINGRDEMNLVEFPLALLSERAPEGLLTLEVSDEIEEKGIAIKRQVTVAANEKYGLPTAKDEDVLMDMLQLAKLQNEFTAPVVYFTRLQLIKLLVWENTRWSYDRITLALERWRSVTITYRKAWRDNKDREWQDRTGFGLIDSYGLRDSRRLSRGGGEGSEPPTESLSWFRWNGLLFDSFRSGYLKKFNYKIYRELEQQAAKRLYRYLDKHFYEPHRMRLDFDLQTLAYEHLGMSRNYDNTQIRRALTPAIAELEQIGFIEGMPAERRFQKLSRGRWRVVFTKQSVAKTPRAVPGRAHPARKAPDRAEQARDAVQEADRRRVQEFLNAQTPEGRGVIEHEALAGAAPFLRQNYESRKEEGGPLFEECRKLIIQQHVLGLIADWFGVDTLSWMTYHPR